MAAGIVRAEGERPSPWFLGIAGSFAAVMGISGVLFGTADERWVFAVLAVGGAAQWNEGPRGVSTRQSQGPEIEEPPSSALMARMLPMPNEASWRGRAIVSAGQCDGPRHAPAHGVATIPPWLNSEKKT